MATIRVRFQGGAFIPEEPVDVPEGQAGVVTIETPAEEEKGTTMEQAWQELMSLVEWCEVHTGIPDLAQRHDHYLYGTPHGEAQE